MLWGGKPAEIIKAAEQNRVVIFVSEEIVAEIAEFWLILKLEAFTKLLN